MGGAETNFENNLNADEILGSQVRCQVFRWESTEDRKQIAEAGPWDMIVGTDLVYPENVLSSGPALLSVFSSLVFSHTQIFIGLQDRRNVVQELIKQIDHAIWRVDIAATK